MATSYSGDPADSALDQVRFLIRDTADPFTFQDEEIAWVLEERPNPYLAAASLAWRLYHRTLDSAGVHKKVGDLQLGRRNDSSMGATNWGTLARQLEREGGLSAGAAPVANADALARPGFAVGEMDNV